MPGTDPMMEEACPSGKRLKAPIGHVVDVLRSYSRSSHRRDYQLHRGFILPMRCSSYSILRRLQDGGEVSGRAEDGLGHPHLKTTSCYCNTHYTWYIHPSEAFRHRYRPRSRACMPHIKGEITLRARGSFKPQGITTVVPHVGSRAAVVNGVFDTE